MNRNSYDTRDTERLFAPLKRVAPAAEFAARSRRLILAAHQESSRGVPFSSLFFPKRLAFGLAFGGAALLFFLAVQFIASDRETPSTLTSGGKLLEEARALEFRVQLGEAAYFEESAHAVSMALQKLSGTPREGERSGVTGEREKN